MTGKSTITDEFAVVDFGAHFYPPELDPTRPGVDFGRTGVDRVADPGTQIAEIEAGGIDAMAHSMTFFLGHDAERTADANDALVESVVRYDEYYGLASLPTAASGEEAAA